MSNLRKVIRKGSWNDYTCVNIFGTHFEAILNSVSNLDDDVFTEKEHRQPPKGNKF